MIILLLIAVAGAPDPAQAALALTAGHHLPPRQVLILAREPEVAHAIAAVALDDKAAPSSRLRAINLLGLAPRKIASPAWARLSLSRSSLIRAEAIWASGLANRDLTRARGLLTDPDPRVRNVAKRLVALPMRKLEHVPQGGRR